MVKSTWIGGDLPISCIILGSELYILLLFFIFYCVMFKCSKDNTNTFPRSRSRSNSRLNQQQKCSNDIIILTSLVLSSLFVCVMLFANGLSKINFIKEWAFVNKYFNDNNHCIYVCIGITILIFQRLNIYCNDLYRVRITFKGSLFEVKQSVIVVLYVLVTLVCISYITGISYYLFKSGKYICDNTYPPLTLVVLFGFLDVFIRVILLKLFTKRLKASLELRVQDNILNILQKLNILNIVSILSTVVIIGLYIMSSFSLLPINLSSMLCELLGFDLIMNNLCLILTFRHTNRTYNFCCKLCRMVAPKYKATSIDPNDNLPTQMTVNKLATKYGVIKSASTVTGNNINNIDLENKLSKGIIKYRKREIKDDFKEDFKQDNSKTNLSIQINGNNISKNGSNKSSLSSGLSSNDDEKYISDILVDKIENEPFLNDRDSIDDFTNKLMANHKDIINAFNDNNNNEFKDDIKNDDESMMKFNISENNKSSISHPNDGSQLKLDFTFAFNVSKSNDINAPNFKELKAKTERILNERLHELGVIC